jgi:thioredoxin 1
MLDPIVESIAADTSAVVAKVDVDALQDLAREYQVQGVPTLYLFADGEPTERLVGMQDESRLRSLVDGCV